MRQCRPARCGPACTAFCYVVFRLQLLQFQKPARPLPSSELYGPSCPTATQSATAGQLTSLNRLALPLPGAATFPAVQLLPFHAVAAAWPVWPPSLKLASTEPTATQLLADPQDTATRKG